MKYITTLISPNSYAVFNTDTCREVVLNYNEYAKRFHKDVRALKVIHTVELYESEKQYLITKKKYAEFINEKAYEELDRIVKMSKYPLPSNTLLELVQKYQQEYPISVFSITRGEK